jgi:uncharacterized protein
MNPVNPVNPETSGDWLVAPELAPDPADPDTAPLYAAAARGVLAMPFCVGCGIPLELEQSVCDACGAAERQWREVPRTGTVYAATLVHRRERELIVAAHPYPVIDVELTSGHRLVLTTTQACEHAHAIGAPVEIAFRTVGDVALPAVRVEPSTGEKSTGEKMP